ncbi:putative aldehyde dehydrogenase-like protein C9E9.09c [Obelidium mucronatum]|nr:putative aldehyde dehydrogenase-like protein C9E9.09c [Obelidium mucronatum]
MTNTSPSRVSLPCANGAIIKVPTGLFINNQFVTSFSGARLASVDPNTNKVICEVYEAELDDVNAAVSAAASAFPAWAKTVATARAALLNKLADLIELSKSDLALVEALDTGKLIKQAHDDVDSAVKDLRFFAACADKHDGAIKNVDGDSLVYTKHEPFGVVGLIVPWNYPFYLAIYKLAPAVVTGNTVVIKTSEKTPLSTLKLCELIIEAGFPKGVINVLSGYGSAGDAIARHMDVQKVSFTGSTATGRKVMIAAAESNIKSVSLELGGKSPMIVFDDADLESSVDACHEGFTSNAGQICCAGTRIYVQEGIYDAFLQKLKTKTISTVVGPSTSPNSELGPLVDTLQFDKVLGYLKLGQQEGAVLECGGSRIGSEGCFMEPAIFSKVNEEMRIVKEEIFGPVVCIMKFKTIEEAIQRANNSVYGLAAGVFTSSLSTAVRMTNALKAGTVWTNGFGMGSSSLPFGGYKQSGYGKDGGLEALATYTQTKSVYMNL